MSDRVRCLLFPSQCRWAESGGDAQVWRRGWAKRYGRATCQRWTRRLARPARSAASAASRPSHSACFSSAAAGLTSEACLAGTHKNADKPGGLASKENYHKAMVRALDSGKKTVRRQSTLLLSSFNIGLVSEWYAWQGLEAAQLDEDEKLCLQRGTRPLP